MKKKPIVFEGVEQIVFKYPELDHVINRGMSPGYIGTTAKIANGHLQWNSYTEKLTVGTNVYKEGETLVVIQS